MRNGSDEPFDFHRYSHLLVNLLIHPNTVAQMDVPKVCGLLEESS